MPPSASVVSSRPSIKPPRGMFLAATSLTFLKPLFKTALRPSAVRLAQAGFTANQVTLASLFGSIAVGGALCAGADHPMIFTILPVWLLIRMACATIDGTLAIEFRQKSRIGGILNEVGDVVSDTMLLMPLAWIAPFSAPAVLLLVALTALVEVVGMLGVLLGGDRRLEGPLGKADRTVLLAILAVTIAIYGEIPADSSIIVPALAAGLALTIWNRLRCALADRRQGGSR